MFGSSILDQPQVEHLALDEVAGGEFPHPERTRVIVVANQKGGVGKASAAVNLTAALAEGRLHALPVDAGSQGNVSTALGVEHDEDNASIYDALADTMPIKDAVTKTRFYESLWYMPAAIDVAAVEIELISAAKRESRLRRALVGYLASYEMDGLELLDYVIIGYSPSLGIMTINAFVATDEMFIPMQAEYYALEGLALLTRSIDRIARIHNPGLGVSMTALTVFNGRTTLARKVGSEVRSYFPDATLDIKVPRLIRVAEASSFGAPVVFWDPRSTGAITYRKVAREVALRDAPQIEGEKA